MYKKGDGAMKIKLFYRKFGQAVEEFETEVNNFMADVEVVDVKYTEATTSCKPRLETRAGILVL